MKRYVSLFLALGITTQASAQTLAPWENKSGFFQSTNSKRKLYVPATLTANLGESVLITTDLDASGEYIGRCTQYIYKGIQSDSIILEKLSYRVTSSQPTTFGKIGEAIQNNPDSGFPLLIAACFQTAPRETTTYFVPKTWSKVPLDLNGLALTLSLLPDNTLRGQVTLQK